MPITHFAANEDLDARYGSGSPASIFFAIFTSMPDLAGAGAAEPTDTAYARIEKTNNATNFPAAALGVKTVDVEVAWAAADDGYTMVGIGLYDASTGGNLMHYQQLAANQEVPVGDFPRFAAGEIQIIR